VTKPSRHRLHAAAAAWSAAISGPRLRERIARAVAADHDRWILWGPTALALGIAAYFALPVEPPRAVSGLAVLAAGAGMVLTPRFYRPLGVLLLLPAIGLGLAQLRTGVVAAPVLAESVDGAEVTGIADLVERDEEGGLRITIAEPAIAGLAPERTPERVRVTARTEAGELRPGDSLRVEAHLEPPPGPVAPGAFDFARRAYFDRLGAVGYAYSPVTVTETGRFSRFWQRVHALRTRVAERVRSHVAGGAGALSAAMLTGLREAIPDGDVEAMRSAGLAHLLAISGLHLGLVTATAFFFLRAGCAGLPSLALRLDLKKIAAVGAWLVALAYLLLAGATLPTQRAFLMASVMLLALLIGRQPISLRLVAFAAAVILVFTPEALLSASFQMSFSAVVALVAVYESAAPKLAALRRQAGWPQRIALYFLGVLLTTLVAELAIGPFAAFHFNRVTAYGLLANLVAVPVMAFWIMPCGLLALLAMPLGLAGPIVTLMGWGAELVLTTAREVAALPGAVHHLPAYPAAALTLGAVGALWLVLWRAPILKAGAVLPLAAATVLAASHRPPDILMSREGDLIAFNGAERLYVSAMERADYDRKEWMRLTGHDKAAPWESAPGREVAPARCDGLGCSLRPRRTGTARRISVAFTPEALMRDCRVADVLLAAVPVPEARGCSSPELVLDRFDVWREGAYGLWIEEDGLRVESARDLRGDRPWVREPEG